MVREGTRGGGVVLVAVLVSCGGQVGNGGAVSATSDAGLSTGPTVSEDASGHPRPFDGSISKPPTLPDASMVALDARSPELPDSSVVHAVDGDVKIDAAPPPAIDAGCIPRLPPGYSASPKGVAAAACTAEQIAGTVQGCFLQDATDASCAPYAQGSCWACIETPASAASWGAYVEFSASFYDVNYGGCIARLDPTPAGQKCGAAYTQFEECLDQACAARCPPDPSSENPYEGLQTCENEASGVDCSTLQDAEEVACASEGVASQQCNTLLGYSGQGPDGGAAAQIVDYITVLCGQPDGGS